MMQSKLEKLAFWGGAIFNTLIWVVIAICAYNKGYSKAIADIQATIKVDKKTLENHAKKIETIRTEPIDSVSARLRKNLSTN